MPLPFAAAAGTAAGKIAGGLLGDILNAHPKDKIRLQRNKWLYDMAVNGDKAAFYHLGLMSRRVAAPVTYTYGPLPDGWTGTVPAGKKWNGKEWGWPTTKAADDAWKKYQAVQAYFGGGQGGVGSTSIPGVPTTGNGVDRQGNPDNNGASQPGGLTFQGAGVAGGSFVVWGAVAAVAYVAARYFKLVR